MNYKKKKKASGAVLENWRVCCTSIKAKCIKRLFFHCVNFFFFCAFEIYSRQTCEVVHFFPASLRKHFYAAIDNCHQALLAGSVSFKPSPNALAPL